LKNQIISCPWVIRLAAADRAALAGLRLMEGLEVAEDGASIWLRGRHASEAVTAVLRRLPAVARLEWLAGDRLRPWDARIPSERLPALRWEPLAGWLRVASTVAGLPGWPPAPAGLRLVRGGEEQSPELLLTGLKDWNDFVAEAAEIRLQTLRFAVDDRQRVLVFYYKIASLYFGSGDYERTITYLNKIINWKVDLRNDLQCYARLLHLIAHYELGNFDLLEYLVKSVYRFMAKMENLGYVEEEVFKFLQRSFHLSASQLKPEFEKLLAKLKQYEHNRFATRAFAYLDIISWLESKINNEHVQDVIRKKSMEHKRFSAAKSQEP